MKIIQLLVLLCFIFSSAYAQDSIQIKPSILMSNKDQRLRLLVSRLGDYQHFVGKSFGDFEVKNDAGETIINNNSLKGKVVFINFWFESCKFCHELFKPLNSLFNYYKNNPDVQIISFCPDPIKMIQSNVIKYKLYYPVYPLSWAACDNLKVDKGYPANFLLNKHGEIVYGNSGGEFLDSNFLQKQLITKIDSLLIK